MRALEEEKPGATLKDGGFVNLRIASITKNKHYVSPESIKRTRKKRELWDEYQHLKDEGFLSTPKEYIAWKKKQVKNEKERTT